MRCSTLRCRVRPPSSAVDHPGDRARRFASRAAGRGTRGHSRQIARRPRIAKANALASALPAMTGAMEDLEKALDKIAANVPDPTYPKR